VLIASAWPYKPWWQRLRSGTWCARLVKSRNLPANILIPYNGHCFFGEAFY